MKIDYPESIKPSDCDQFLAVFSQLVRDKVSHVTYNGFGTIVTIHFKDGSRCGGLVPWTQAGLIDKNNLML